LAFGGSKRFQSVQNGLDAIDGDGIVFIHDGVRPLVSAQTIQNCNDTALMQGNALPVVAPSESIRYSFGNENKAVDRTRFFMVQTPQTFKVAEIKTAYQNAPHQNFTDDASVLEFSGLNIHLVEGNRENIKITWPQDLILASTYLSSQQQ
jgi:2-C-methyl-D-erythritol 4-phosphate cytidylyltransferase